MDYDSVYITGSANEYLEQIAENTKPINVVQEEMDQQEKFEFLKAAAIAYGQQVWACNDTVSETVIVMCARDLMEEVFKHKGKL